LEKKKRCKPRLAIWELGLLLLDERKERAERLVTADLVTRDKALASLS
jgi:hypothetical protein